MDNDDKAKAENKDGQKSINKRDESAASLEQANKVDSITKIKDGIDKNDIKKDNKVSYT
jgi:hypothetical protein